MATIIKCDVCGKMNEPCVTVELQETSPHNGDIYWDEKDVCYNCLKGFDTVRAYNAE